MALKHDQMMIELLTEILKNLKFIERNLRPVQSEAVKFEFDLIKLTPNGEVRVSKMDLQLNENALVKVKAIKDAAGNPAKVEGDKLNWGVEGDQSLGTLEVSEDGLSAKFVRNGGIGSCVITVTGDADLGPDEKLIKGSVEVNCLGGQAVEFELDASPIPA